MKKKIIIILIVCIAVVATIVYFYAYKPQRNIATEKSDFEISVANIENEFASNDSAANKKYLDKTITIYGKITNIDLKTKGIILDEKIYVTLDDLKENEYSVNQSVKVKGRFIGFDDLLGEYRLDQGTILK